MTVLDANNSLFEWFRANHSFELERDLKKIIPIFDDEAETIIAFRLALEELEENSLVASQEYNQKKFYVLTKPFESYNQNPDVSSWTSGLIGTEINDFCDLIQDYTDQCSPSNLIDKDFRNLVHISQYYKQKLVEKESIITALSEFADDLPDKDEGDDDDKKKKKKK